MDRVKKQTFRAVAIVIGIIVLISNYPGVKEITGINDNYYRYSNYSGTVARDESLWEGLHMRKSFVNGFWNCQNLSDNILLILTQCFIETLPCIHCTFGGGASTFLIGDLTFHI